MSETLVSVSFTSQESAFLSEIILAATPGILAGGSEEERLLLIAISSNFLHCIRQQVPEEERL